MKTISDSATAFAYVADNHPWHADLQILRAAVAAAPIPPTSDDPVVRRSLHAEIKGLRQGDGTWVLDRAYWSQQFLHPTLRWGMQVHTLSCDRRNARHQWLTLPTDPYLGEVAEWLKLDPQAQRVQILRYVPLRRLTFRCHATDGRTPLIGKFKRRSRYAQAYGLIGLVAKAVAAAEREGRSVGFQVARPVAMVPQRALYFQETLPGHDVSEAIGPDRGWSALGQIGRLHARLHGLAAGELPVSTPLQQRDQALADLAWIAWLQPGLAAQLRPLAQRVAQVPAWSQDDLLFCHGDLVCSQFLADGDQWSITDFDLCHRGDPCRDIAILLASLTYDVPALEAAEQRPGSGADIEQLSVTYLDAYAAQAGQFGRTLPAERLHWQRLCAEIYYLALMLKKDRYHLLSFIRRLRRAQRFAGLKEWT